MSRKEKIKVELDLFKTLIVTLLTALFGILAFSALNYQNFTLITALSVVLAIFVLIGGLIILAKQFKKQLNNLEKED
ncbi:hypothetical protein [Campylobacter vulpis]|uniref:hypothetical protein n=1 Tax=Campylobacter vulpis TaxID=1655500 RepID=UPI001BCD8A8A|nr:hypothetical protein [Campylobacter vulpis]MBS4407599.1 hypothetical protein [Campylobacter vulpis]